MWSLYQTAKTFNQRPSALLDVSEPYAAYCLDNACGEFGRAIENELGKIEGKKQGEIDVKADRLLRKWLDLPAQFRSPPAAAAIALPPAKADDDGV